MNAIIPISDQNWNQSDRNTAKVRILAVEGHAFAPLGDAVFIVRQPLMVLQSPRADSLPPADCFLLPAADLASIAPRALAIIGLPVIVELPAKPAPADLDAIDHADGFVFADDEPAMRAAVLARAMSGRAGGEVHDLSPDIANQINAISAEANRIASALARLAADPAPITEAELVDAPLVRRLIRMRRERDRFFPADIFADPAWDMMLDLIAAQLEGKQVPVSSLCIAAAVPTTTALRWVRSLSQAGLFVRSTDPRDARRTWISLSPEAADGMLGWLRAFAAQFLPRH